MRGLAEQAGHRGTVLVNTCAVTAEAEKQARQAIRAAHRREPRRAHPGDRLRGADRARPPGPSLPGVSRVVPNPDKLRPEAWARDAPPAAVRHHGRAPRPARRTRSPVRAAAPAPSCRCRAAATTAAPSASSRTAAARPAPSRSTRSPSRCRALVEAGHREAVLTGVDIASYGADLPGRRLASAPPSAGCWRWCRSCRGCASPRSTPPPSTTTCGACSPRSRA